MLIYLFWALMKVVVSIVIFYIWLNKINPFEDPLIAVIVFWVSVFLFVWWILYFVILLFMKIIDNRWYFGKVYKITFLFGLFFWLNSLLILLWYWNKFIGLLGVFVFLFLEYYILKNG